jgi:hypothetical protein
MNVELTDQERDLILEMIESAEKRTIHGMDHADSRAFKHVLRVRMHVLESLKEKIEHQLHPARS